MSKSFKSKYTVENVPIYWKPLYWIYGYGLGFLLYFLMYLLHKSLSIKSNANKILDKNENYIYCFWHQDLAGFYASYINQKDFNMINHPAWYMKPIHVFSKCCGQGKIFYGSTGHGGVEAAKKLAVVINKGNSTFITPDGPNGPKYKLNKGVLYLSLESKKPIVVLKFKYWQYRKLSGWDEKLVPLPFSKLKIEVLEPIQVTQQNFEESASILKDYLND